LKQGGLRAAFFVAMAYYVYMLASGRHGTLYVGVTNDLARRIFEHKEKLTKGFTSTYDVTRLVWYESYEQITEAISREKAIKKWHRDWKIRLIEEMNPEWEDLYLSLNQ
jgi:putative endonuclease